MFSFFKRKKSGGGERKRGKGRAAEVPPPNPDRSDMGNDHSLPASGPPSTGSPPVQPAAVDKELLVDEENNLPILVNLQKGNSLEVSSVEKVSDLCKPSQDKVISSRKQFFSSSFNVKEDSTKLTPQNLQNASFSPVKSELECVLHEGKPPVTETVSCIQNTEISSFKSPPDTLMDKNGYMKQGNTFEDSKANLINSINEVLSLKDIKTQGNSFISENSADKDITINTLDLKNEDIVTSSTISETDFSNISVKSESECFEECVNRDEKPPANETEEAKSVTDNVGDYVLDLAKTGAVASREEYSSGNSPDGGSTEVVEESSRGMHRLGTCRIEGPPEGLKFYENTYEGLKGMYEGNGAQKGPLQPLKYKEAEEKAESSESSEEEEESSEDSESDSDNVVKNDSGCWEERDSCLFSKDNLAVEPPPLTEVSSILFHGGRLPRVKKHVKWADIDGKTELTRANTETLAEVTSSSEEEESEEEEDKEKEGSSESEEESGESEEDEKPEELPQPPALEDTKREDTWLDTKSSSPDESDEDEEEEDEEEECDREKETQHKDKEPYSGISEVKSQRTVSSVGNEESENSESEEEETSEDETSEDEPVENNAPNTIRIDVAEMQKRIAELQKDIDNKTSNIDRLQEELDSACSESEKVRQRFKRLEEDLELYRKTNRELTEKLQTTEQLEEEKVSRSNYQLNEAERRIKSLESELENLKVDYSKLQISYKKLQADRDMEVQIIQKALEKALTDQEEMEAKYEKEFENLRTLNSGREVQMLDDFEWKLREVERNCKKKIQDYETEYEQKNLLLANQLAAAQADLEQISHLKLCEIELNQLKQTSSEQRKNLRTVNRKLEELQVSEKILQEEVNSLRSSLDKEKAHIVALQTMHKEELAEKDRKMKVKMEIQIKQLTQEWEERLRRETYKIKTDLERTSREERIAAVDLAHNVKDQEISQLKHNWEMKSTEFKNEIEKLKNKIKEIESHRRSDLDNAQTNADRELFDLRRKMDKLDMNYQEKIEKLQEKHEVDIGFIKEEYEKRVQQTEATLQMQISNSRTTLELVKQQMQNDSQLKLEKLEYQYQHKFEQQRQALEKEKESALQLLEEKHKGALEMIYKEIERTKKQARNEHENLVKRKNQPQSNQVTQAVSHQKNKSQDNDKGHSQSLISSRLDVADVAEEIRTQGKEEVLQRSIEQLTKQLNAGKMEIEKLRQQLEARESRLLQQPQQQQRNNLQQPVPNPRRNRKGRSGRN